MSHSSRPHSMPPSSDPTAHSNPARPNSPQSPQASAPEPAAKSQPVPDSEATLARLRQEFAELCQIHDPLEQSYRLLQYAKASELPPEEYRALFDRYHRPTAATQEKLLRQLTDEFKDIASIHDPIKRNYRLIQLAKASEIDTDEYRELFEEFERKQATGVQALLGSTWRRIRTLGTILGSLTIFWGIVLFILEADSRQQEAHTQAWQIITSNKGSTESAGRIQALQTLAEGCRPPETASPPLTQSQSPQTQPLQSQSTQTQTVWAHALGSLSETFDPDNVSWREMPIIGGFFPDCISLRGLNITDAHLPELSLPWADLRNARMQDTRLWSANLQGAQLQGSQLQRSRLRNASLQGANFEGATLEEADLAGASFYCPPLQQSSRWVQLGLPRRAECVKPASFATANLSRANLRGDDLNSPTHLGRSILTDVELEGALYDTYTKLEVCEIDDTNATAANPDGCRPVVVDIPTFLDSPSQYQCVSRVSEGKVIWRASACRDIERAFGEAHAIAPNEDLIDINLNRAELSEANLNQANLTDTTLQGAKLRQAQLNGAILADAFLDCDRLEVSAADDTVKSLVNTIITCTDLRDAQLTQANLTNASLMGANLAEANLQGANLSRADLSCTFAETAQRRCTDLSDANLQNADLSNANLQNANLQNANLKGATGWTVEQIQAATHWQQAIYDNNQRQALGL